VIPRTQYHEDKTISIVLIPCRVRDKVGFKGYYLRKRPLDIPNPLAEHPFLKANEDTFYCIDGSVEGCRSQLGCCSHARDSCDQRPYGEAARYLKLWDVKLSSVPWSSWKSKFPPVDPVNAHEAPAPG